MRPISRREFGAVLAAGVAGARLGPLTSLAQGLPANVPVSEIIDRIRRNIGVEWRAETVDTVKTGDPDALVTGVVTTSLATMDVLRRAVENGSNFVVTSEPTFYGRADSRAPRAPGGPPGAGAPPPAPRPDPMYDAKNQYIDGNGIIVMRLSDHWRLRQPDGFVQGLADTLFGPGTVPSDAENPRYDIPAIPLDELASDVKRRLASRGGMRIFGEPGIRVRKVALLPGSTAIAASLAQLPSVDVIIAGEVREWESAEYARDVVFSGQAKGMILLGRVLSEDPGMNLCAKWLESIIPEVPVRHISSGDPYWRPLL